MARRAAAEVERFKESLRAHAMAGNDLSLAGYAAVAGIHIRTARKYCRFLGLPYGGNTLFRYPLPTSPEEKAAQARRQTRGSAQGTGGAPPPPRPAAIRASVLDAEAVNGLVAEIRSVPQAVAGAVREVLQPSPRRVAKGTDEQALEAARSVVAENYVRTVAEDAAEEAKQRAELGEVFRRWWHEKGLEAEFPGEPATMVDIALGFWWENRKKVSWLYEQLDRLQSENLELHRQLDPENRRAAALDEAWKRIAYFVVSGVQVSHADIEYHLRIAEAVARGEPIPSA